MKETFPTSDPVSVTITKGGAIDYDENGKPMTGDQSQGAGGPDEGPLGQARETLGSAAASASDMARGAYEQGQRYVRQAGERYPEAQRYYREGTRAIREYVPENPLWTLLLGAVAGYGIAWMIHHERWRDQDDERPGYARTRGRSVSDRR